MNHSLGVNRNLRLLGVLGRDATRQFNRVAGESNRGDRQQQGDLEHEDW
ncbi:MAG: hypothetical protein WD872_13510 [Pirellulaceae bacterium]